MATEPTTETQTATKLKLDPPAALNPLAPAEAAGLVPLKTEETSELDRRVDQFVDESLMAGREAIFIIHGHGTGALKTAIRSTAETLFAAAPGHGEKAAPTRGRRR